jgi:ABC-type branched-subunit amino acid transport system ATPase component
MLKLSHLSKHFGGLQVLQDVSFEVPTGTIFGLIGPNGAGKTTVFNLITGLQQPSGGDILFEGRSLPGHKPHQVTQLGIARTFQNIRVFKEMTLLQNVTVGAHRHLGYGTAGLLFSLKGFREQEQRARPRDGAAVLGQAGPQARRAGRQPVLRRPAQAGAGTGAGHAPQAADARRAGGGHEQRREDRADARH